MQDNGNLQGFGKISGEWIQIIQYFYSSPFVFCFALTVSLYVDASTKDKSKPIY